jgi:hypothetical protein
MKKANGFWKFCLSINPVAICRFVCNFIPLLH